MTSEKCALAHYLDSRVSFFYGTHTHVPTFDGRVLPGGTGLLTAVGMTGPLDSVIGIDKKIIIKHFLTGMPVAHEIPEGETWLNAIVVTLDPKTGTTKSIVQIQEKS